MTEKLGPTGKFPYGKLGPDDEGELTLGVTHDGKGNIYVEFGKSVEWIAMPRRNAIELALLILRHAGITLRRGKGETIEGEVQ